MCLLCSDLFAPLPLFRVPHLIMLRSREKKIHTFFSRFRTKNKNSRWCLFCHRSFLFLDSLSRWLLEFHQFINAYACTLCGWLAWFSYHFVTHCCRCDRRRRSCCCCCSTISVSSVHLIGANPLKCVHEMQIRIFE